MALWTWIITVVAVSLWGSQDAKGIYGQVQVQETPVQVRTARAYLPLPLYGTDATVAIEVVMFRESHHSTSYPALVILNMDMDDYKRSSYFGVSVLDIRNIAKTWQPFPQEIDIEEVLSIACSKLRWPPAVTASPYKHLIVMYGFGTGQCADKLLLYGDRRSRVVTTTGGHAAMGAALATMAVHVGESDHSTFDLFAFGGAECLDENNSSCRVFGNSLRRLRIESSEAGWKNSSHEWTIVGDNKTMPVPVPTANARMFADGASLLVFTVYQPSSTAPCLAHFLPEVKFWRYSFVRQQWDQLEYDLITNGYKEVFPSSRVQAAFISEESVLMFVHGISLYLCSISSSKASCTKYKNDLLFYSYYPTAGQSFFYLNKNDMTTESYLKVEVKLSSAVEAKTIQQISTTQIEEDSDARCPVFQGYLSAPSIFVPRNGRQTDQYLFFTHSDSPVGERWFKSRRKPTMSIWSIFEAPDGYMYFHAFNSPAPSSVSSVTYQNPSTALLYDKRSQVWCLSIATHSWTLASGSSSHVPAPRRDQVAFKHSSMGMFLYGGQDGKKVLDDLWLFQLGEGKNCTGSWHDLTNNVIEGKLPKRYGHAVVEYGDGVIVFGGRQRISPVLTSDITSGTMFMLQIKSRVHVVVRNIEINPPIQNRFYHTLSVYTRTDLLLLGGQYFSKELGEWAEDALLITVEKQKHTIVAKWAEFFKFRISHHSVLNNRIFSGVDSTMAKTHQFYVLKNTNQCPKGYQRERNNSCLPCPVGYYSSTIEQQCEKCANLTTTKSKASTACEPINQCVEEYCHGHGTCFVNKADYKPFCTCQFGYVASDRCKVPSVYLALMAAVVFATTATILVIALYQFIRKRRALNATEIQLGHTNRDLQRHRKKLHRINRGTLIRWSDLTIREQLASGTYSKVLLAELGDMTVAVKQFPSYFPTSSLSSPFDVFIQEAEILRGLRHPNIVMFLGAGRDATSRCPFLVMEYLKRGSLHDVLHDLSNPIEHCDRLRFALDAARGLKYLHSSSPPQIHRDIKSPNLLVSDKWVVKVGDLETARFLATYQSDVNNGDDRNAKSEPQLGETSGRSLQHSVSYNSGSNQLTTPLLTNNPPIGNTAGDANVTSRVGMTCGAGTDRWRSPESIQKNIYTDKHDMYSYGVVLWEIFTRQTPYCDFTCSEDILDEIVNERKPIFPPSAPYAYRHLAEQCMKTDAVDRPSIQRVVRELTGQIENY